MLTSHPLPAATPEQQREGLFGALIGLFHALAAQLPVALLVEDLQWCDASTLAFLERLVQAAREKKLLLLLTARPDFEPPWPAAEVQRVPLGRLAVGPTLEIVDRQASGRSLAVVLKREIADRSDGVPLFVEELTRAVIDSSFATEPSDRVSIASGREIPATLHGLLMSRLDQLGRAKPAAQLASVLGREFRFAVLERLGELDGAELRAALQELVEKGLVLASDSPSGDLYRFRHALVQDAAYASLLRRDRRRLHARVAAVLAEEADVVAFEPARLARHYAEAQDYAAAAQHYQAAGARAAARYAIDEAIECLELALDALAHLPADRERRPQELALRLALAPPLIAKRSLDDAAVHALHARIAALSDELPATARMPALLYLSRYHLRRGDVAKSAEMGTSLLGVAHETGIPLIEVAARLILGSAELTRSPADVAIAQLERALAMAKGTPLPPPTAALEPEMLAFIHATLGLALAIGGRFDAAAEQAAAARERAFAVAHEPTCILVLALSTITLTFMTEFEQALAWGREALALASGRGFGSPEAQAHTMAGWSRVALGDVGGLEQVETGLARAEQAGFRGGYTQFVWAAAEAHRLAGRLERSLALLDLARRTYERTGEVVFAGRVRRTRAMIHLAEGQRAQAETELRAAAAQLAEVGARAEQLMAETELLRIAGCSDGVQRRRVEALLAELGGARFRPQRAARELLGSLALA